MNYYQDITLLPDADISLGFIWQNVFQQVHLALVEHKVAANESAIAVGFPDYGQLGFPLGNRLRLFAKEPAQLDQLAIRSWLERLADYTHVKEIKPVPSDTAWVSFSRKHVKSPERIEREMQEKAKRWSIKSNKPLEVCLQELEKSKPVAHSHLPFIYLHSQQTKQRSPDNCSKFPLFISQTEVANPQEGIFDCYGLSSKANSNSNLGCVPQF